ncbi:MAG: hypothetical protein KDA21_01685, partial [Phycisphaerales bacterium]|nr:hypothetical protein [Phycisphaerales bacterium]
RRWEEFTDEDLHEDLRIQRTKHYLVLSNAGGSLFAKKMEEFYDDIQKVYPFEEVRGRRLMPVFVFRTKDQYVKYYARVAEIPESEAERSKGHAWRDYYATYYESPNDPVHIHEATHQVFFNRLGLHGGGSWFQEGVAEYMSANGNEVRSVVRGRIKSDDATPFRSLMVVPSLLQSLRGGSIRGGSAAGNAYTEAASIIAFVRESRFGKAKFQEFIRAVGQAPESDLEAIDAALQEVYQVGIDEFEEEWKRYWAR